MHFGGTPAGSQILAISKSQARIILADYSGLSMRFFSEILPRIVRRMSALWNAHKAQLVRYANDEINLAQIYTEIDSPVAGKWQDFTEEPPVGIWDYSPKV